jgi:hypothetical protein
MIVRGLGACGRARSEVCLTDSVRPPESAESATLSAPADGIRAPASPPPMAAAISGERYVSERLLGQGAMGAVHLVRDRETGERLAIKKLACSPRTSVSPASTLAIRCAASSGRRASCQASRIYSASPARPELRYSFIAVGAGSATSPASNSAPHSASICACRTVASCCPPSAFNIAAVLPSLEGT